MRLYLFVLIMSLPFGSARGQTNRMASIFPAGDHSPAFQWTIGEVFSGFRPDPTGASLTVGFVQPSLTLTTDLHQTQEKVNLSVFPIPARNYLTVNFNRMSDWTLMLMNGQGQTLASWYIRGQQAEIPVENWAPGVYLLRVVDSKRRSQTIRFIKH